MSCPHGHPRCPCTPDLPREPPPPPHLPEMDPPPVVERVETALPDLAEIGRTLGKATFEIGWIITPEALREAVEATLKEEGTLGGIKVLSSPYAPKDQVLLLARSSLLDEAMLGSDLP